MSRRGRAIGFAALAAVCAIASASIATGYRDSVDAQLGELRVVAVATATLERGERLDRRTIARSIELREVPERFAPPDALSEPAAAIDRRLLAAVPAGSYLVASVLRVPGPPASAQPHLAGGLQPVEITVTGAGALAALGDPGGTRVDVIVAGEPVTGGRARVRVVAAGVRLVALEPASPEEATTAGGDSWNATLALRRSDALDLIEAENFAREVRLIPSG